jgi:hypothetical protein
MSYIRPNNSRNFPFVGLPHLAAYIFLIFSTIEPEIGAGIDPGMAISI